jgi:cytoskeletal protein CcmA (bactofilin family)
MTINGFRLGAPDIAYIGAGVTVKGALVVPDAIIVDGVVEGDVTARSIRIGPSGAIKGKVVSTDIDVSGTLAEKADVKEFLLVRSSSRVEGHVNCGDVQVERGAVLAGGIFSVYSAAAKVKPVNDNRPANAPERDCRGNRSADEDRRRRIGSRCLLQAQPPIRAATLAVASPGETARMARVRSARLR